ncbi:Mu transposase C-terminal domain-containing protein [Streptomyces sp. NPDC048384]|uniref:Mu transposase C-terminal domain-containing protein n=1 Tax=Streptomyces sp. NPDC048384 TaxID=3155487 RepID=UPI00342F4392
MLSTKGIRFRNRDYMAAWMTGLAGERVWVRFMPHHDRRTEVFDAATGRYLGPAEVADRAGPEQISAVRPVRAPCDRGPSPSATGEITCPPAGVLISATGEFCRSAATITPSPRST